MKKKVKSQLITAFIILTIILISYISITSNNTKTTEEIAICIGENSILYTQLGCSHCETQKQLFGKYENHLTIIDCFYEGDKCTEITMTPTWKINGKLITGLQKIEDLRKLTKC